MNTVTPGFKSPFEITGGPSVSDIDDDFDNFQDEEEIPRRSPLTNERSSMLKNHGTDKYLSITKEFPARNRRPKVVSHPGELQNEFVKRGIVSITHDMRDNNYLGTAVLDQLKKMETSLIRRQQEDIDDDGEFLQNLSLKTMEEFESLDNELENKATRKLLYRHLVGIGGRKPRIIIRSIAKRLISKDLGKEFFLVWTERE